MNLCVVGYPTILDRNFKVLEEMAKLADVYAIMPNRWKVKAEVLYPPTDKNVKILSAKAFVHHSKFPLVGGLLKGIMPSVYSKIKKIHKKIDLIYTMMEPTSLSTFYDLAIAKKFGLKHVFFTWENLRPKRAGWKERLGVYSFVDFIQKKNVRYSDGIITGNMRAKEIMEELGGKKITVLPQTGVDIKEFNPRVEPIYKKKLGLSNKVVILFAGGFVHGKGVHILINSIPLIIKEEKNVHFIICGTGELEEELKRKVEASNLEDFVTFMKWVSYEEMPSLHASADIFVYPSIPTPTWEEQFGYSMVEANACGVPVVATMTGSIPEVIKNTETGLLVPPNNEKALAIALLSLIKDEGLRRKMGKKGRKKVEENFSNEIVAKKTVEFFSTLIEEN